MKIGIIVAMTSELDCVLTLLQNAHKEMHNRGEFFVGSDGQHEIILTQSGIGKVNAALRAQTLILNYAPDCIVNTGVAGGIDASSQVFDVIIGTETVYHDAWFGEGNVIGQIQGLPPRFPADAELLQKIGQILSDDNRIYGGLICSGDQFITDKESLAVIKKNFPEAMAVDMESAAIAQTCFIHDTPFVSTRIISDTPGVENHMEQYNSFWEKAPEKSFTVLKQILAQL